MIEEMLRVQNPTGLHARPASTLSRLCKGYQSKITMAAGAVEVDPKSIINLLSAGLAQGTEFWLRVEGEDEAEAFAAVRALIESLTE